MRIIVIAIITVGLGLAFFAVRFVQNYIGQYEAALAQANRNVAAANEKAARAIPWVEVYVASTEIAFGEDLTENNVRVAKWSEDTLPTGVLLAKDVELLGDDGAVRKALRALGPNDPLTPTTASEPGQDAGFRDRIGSDEGAFTFNVTVETGTNGMMRPGDYVDVYWTGSAPEVSTGSSSSFRLEPGMEILAINDQEFYKPGADEGPSSITVAGTTEQIAFLAQSVGLGRLSIAQVTKAASLNEINSVNRLVFSGSTPAMIAGEKPICTVTYNRAGVVSVESVPCG